MEVRYFSTLRQGLVKHTSPKFYPQDVGCFCGFNVPRNPSVLFLTMSPYLSESFTKRYSILTTNKDMNLSSKIIIGQPTSLVLAKPRAGEDDMGGLHLTNLTRRFISIFKEHDYSQPLISSALTDCGTNSKIKFEAGRAPCRNLNEYLETQE